MSSSPAFDAASDIYGRYPWKDSDPAYFAGEVLDELLAYCAANDASDVHIQTDAPVIADVQGRKVCVTRRPMSPAEVEAMTNAIYGTNGVSEIRQGKEIDIRYAVVQREANVHGSMIVKARTAFRVNITGGVSRGSDNGVQITARAIKPTPPTLSSLGIEQEIIDNLYPDQGLVCVCGQTGSGKSTLLAAALRQTLEDPEAFAKLITYEAPIEYTFDEIVKWPNVVSQHEVPRHVSSFARGVRNSLRRAPTMILVGETRDSETAQASLEASQTGHAVYTTVHTNGVANTPTRMANMFPPAERMTKLFEIVESMRLLVVQRLVPRSDRPGRIALREYIVFDQAVRDQLRSADSLPEAERMLHTLLKRYGQTMQSSAQRAFDAGVISADQLRAYDTEAKTIDLPQMSAFRP